jgi:hypothetical protein
MAGALLALLLVSPPSAEFRSIIKPSQVSEFFRERMLPQNGWFKGRIAQATVSVSEAGQSATGVR